MRLSSTDVIAGASATVVRSLLRLVRDRDGLSLEEATAVLDATGSSGGTVLDQLIADGHLELQTHNGDQRLDTTITGNAIAGAKFVKPIDSGKAGQILEEFLGRVREANADPGRLHTVERVTVFGSYAKGSTEVGDIDLSVRLMRRLPGDQYVAARKALVEAAPNRPSGIIAEMYYPIKQLLTFLKNRNRYLSITDEDVSRFTDDYRTVYRHADDPAALPFRKADQAGDYPGTPDRATS